MAGLFGWYGNTGVVDPVESRLLLSKMCGITPFNAETDKNTALAVTSSVGGGPVYHTETLVVAITGSPAPQEGRRPGR